MLTTDADRTFRHTAIFAAVALLVAFAAPRADAQNFALEQELFGPAGTNVEFGRALAIDGATAVVGSPLDSGTGSVSVYVRTGGVWALQQKLTESVGSGALYGGAVDIHGETLIVGASHVASGSIGGLPPGQAFIYVRSGTTWTRQTTFTGIGGDALGWSVAIRGDRILMGAPGASLPSQDRIGAVYAAERTGTTWSTAVALRATSPVIRETFGTSVAIDGDTACIGASSNISSTTVRGAGYLFTRGAGGWSQQQRVQPSNGAADDQFGYACDVSGDSAIFGAPNLTSAAGAAFIFRRAGTTWTQDPQLVLSNNSASRNVGTSVSIVGTRAVVGSWSVTQGIDGGANVFNFAAGAWSEQQRLTYLSPTFLTNPTPVFGIAVAFDGTTLIVGTLIDAITYTIQTTPTGPPGAPTGLQATSVGNRLTVSWSAPSSGGSGMTYRTFARLAPGGRVIAFVDTDTQRTFSADAPNGTYVLSVSARNSFGFGPESAPVTVTVPAAGPPPAAPTNLAVSVAGSTATFSWTPPASGGAPTGYTLQAGTSPGFSALVASLALPATATSFSVPDIPAGTYYVRLVAQSSGGTSGPSNEVTVTVAGAAAPGAPTLAATATGSTVNVSWTAGSGGTPTGYTLRASTTPGGSPIATLPVSGTTAAFTNVPSGTYYLTLTASNATGTSAASNQVTVTVP